jgi:hypothetical protein
MARDVIVDTVEGRHDQHGRHFGLAYGTDAATDARVRFVVLTGEMVDRLREALKLGVVRVDGVTEESFVPDDRDPSDIVVVDGRPD